MRQVRIGINCIRKNSDDDKIVVLVEPPRTVQPMLSFFLTFRRIFGNFIFGENFLYDILNNHEEHRN